MDLVSGVRRLAGAVPGWAGAVLLCAAALVSTVPTPVAGTVAAVLGGAGGLAAGAALGRALAGRAARARRAPETPAAPEEPTSAIDMDALVALVASSAEPAVVLDDLCRDILSRASAHDDDPGGDRGPAPCALERYLARELDDAGVHGLVPVAVRARVQPRTGCLRLSVPGILVDFDDVVRARRVESAVNRALFCDRRLGCRAAGGVDDYDRFSASVEGSVVAQVAWHGPGQALGAEGEWDVRRAVAEGLEGFQVPYRLSATWRVNTRARAAAFSVAATPPAAMAPRVWVASVGRAVPATASMRSRAAAHLACREALLVGFHVFDRTASVDEVWVRVDSEDPRRPACLLSARLTRDALAALDPTALGDPVDVLAGLGAVMDWDGSSLGPVEAGFSLEDERFCPPWRSVAPEQDDRPLPPEARRALGADSLADLSRDADRRRDALAEDLARGFGDSTADNVALVLARLGSDGDPGVREAAPRVAERLVDGVLDEAGRAAALRPLTDDCGVRSALARAVALVHGGDAAGAAEGVEAALARSEGPRHARGQGARCFNNYVERSLYNRLEGDGSTVLLAPASHLAAHLLLSAVRLETGDLDAAFAHAYAAVDLDPYDPAARLRLARCYEEAGDVPMAQAAVCDLLERAYDPASAAVGYYRLAFLAWREGDLTLADACYRRAVASGTPCSVVASLELAALEAQEGVPPVPDDEAGRVLAARGVPDSPSAEVRAVVLEGARASVDAGVFPVARDLTAAAAVLSDDEVVLGVRGSIEA